MRPGVRTALALCLYLLMGLSAARAEESAQEHQAEQAAGRAAEGTTGEMGHRAEAAVHEGHEAGPVIRNWFDYNRRTPPPFGYALINFAVFAGILYLAVGKSLREFLHGRHVEVSKALDEAAAIRAQAEQQLERYQEKIRGLDAQVAELLSTVRREAEAERARIIAAAEAQAVQLRKDAEVQIHGEIVRARAELRQATVEAAMKAAETLLRSQIQDADNKRLVEDYVARVEALTPGQKRSAR